MALQARGFSLRRGNAHYHNSTRAKCAGLVPVRLSLLGRCHNAPCPAPVRPARWQPAASVAGTTAAPTTTGDSAAQEASQEQFSWLQQWYPVAATAFLDEKKPHPFTILGVHVVLWKDGTGVWRCFEDACPHRLAPLSEGRVEKDGTLLCAYHAWRFDGAGKLTSLPQAKDQEAFQRACSNPRSCATSYPTREAQGLLWVWPQQGPMAHLESAAKQPAIIEELEELHAERVVALPWLFRDLPYGHDYFIENVTDSAHVTVSHHNVVGNRYAADQYFDLVPEEATTVQGFKYRVTPRTSMGSVVSSTSEFRAPSLVKIKSTFQDGAALILALYSCPTTPGHTRHIGRQILIKNEQGKLPKGLAFFAAPMPVWLSHTLASVFLHQDQVFLHTQEKYVAERQGRAVDKYFMPTPADKMTVAFRGWLEQLAGGAIPYAGSRALPPVDRSRQTVFDTYHTHTAQCSVCKPALENLRVARAAALAAAAAAVLTAAVYSAVAASAKAAALAAAGTAVAAATSHALFSLPPAASLVCLALAALCGGAAFVMHKLIGMMNRYDFSHAEND